MRTGQTPGGAVRPAPDFDPVHLVRSHEYVAEQLRRHIALRLLPPGESLPSERDLAQTFGVGRATVQQALKILQDDGIVEVKRGRTGGTFVLEPHEAGTMPEGLTRRLGEEMDRLEEALAFRTTVEPATAALAAASRDADDLTEIEAAIEAMVAAESELEYMRHDTRFHLAIAAASRNRFFANAVEEARLVLADLTALLPESELWHSRIASEHEAILAAILDEDPQTAAAATTVHVRNAEQGMRSVMSVVRAFPATATDRGGDDVRG